MDPEIRTVESPLTPATLRPFTTNSGVIQFASMLTEPEFIRVGEWMRAYPQVRLRVWGDIPNLEFLRHFPFLRKFTVNVVDDSFESLDGLRHVPEDLEGLAIGWTKRKLDLRIIGRFKSLKTLYLEGQTKSIDVISDLNRLEDLTLRSITLPNLELLLPLDRLLALDLKLGGTNELTLLPRIGRLRYLELWMIKGLTDISAIGNLPHLRYLFLQALRRVENLPDLTRAIELRRIHLETMKGIHDLRPLATAPALEELLLVDMGHLQTDDLRCLVGLPKLKAAAIGLGSHQKNEAATALLRLPDVTQLKVYGQSRDIYGYWSGSPVYSYPRTITC